MARQNTNPVEFARSNRVDEGVLMSSGEAGVGMPALIIPVLKGDSVAGEMSVVVKMAEMPKPLLNASFLNCQVWFVPKAAFPQFAGTDEFLNAYTGTTISALGATDRTPPPYFVTTNSATALASNHFKGLGIHFPAGAVVNVDYIDAFTIVHNFRLAAHSSKLPLKKYWQQDPAKAVERPPAFWPSGRYAAVVPDYEKALLIGSLDLDIQAGKLPVHGFLRNNTVNADPGPYKDIYVGTDVVPQPTAGLREVYVDVSGSNSITNPRVWADMMGTTIMTSLADIDKARTTQAFAKLRTSYAGNDSTGFMNDDMILAYLMQGISVPSEYFRRPWLVNESRVPFGFAERHAMDGENLSESVTTGQAVIELAVNVPHQDVGGYIVAILEVLPERIDERQSDEAVMISTVDQLPNALRDVQRKEPVDTVLNRRVDTKHTTPTGTYGFEPMNNVWNRSFTKLGGIFFSDDPANPFTDARSAIWLAGVIDPLYNEDQFLAPVPFPKNVFSDTQAPAFEFVVRHHVQIVGNTQIGDVLAENNSDWAAVEDGGIDKP